jgi:hypothetical protein
VGCDFFLWESVAAGREAGTVLSSSSSELAPAEGHVQASNKLVEVKREEEEFGEWPLTVKDEISVLNAVESESKHRELILVTVPSSLTTP